MIGHKVCYGSSTQFWRDHCLDGISFNVIFIRLYELVEKEMAIVAEMDASGWGENGEVWK